MWVPRGQWYLLLRVSHVGPTNGLHSCLRRHINLLTASAVAGRAGSRDVDVLSLATNSLHSGHFPPMDRLQPGLSYSTCLSLTPKSDPVSRVCVNESDHNWRFLGHTFQDSDRVL